MKVNYKPTGTSRQNSPKQWEVWLADAPFGGTKKRCAVVVDKRTPAGYTVYEVIPLSLKGAKDVLITDLDRAGQDRPSAVRCTVPATVQNTAFVMKLANLCNEDISKIITSRQ